MQPHRFSGDTMNFTAVTLVSLEAQMHFSNQKPCAVLDNVIQARKAKALLGMNGHMAA
jgi:hypothetical protein